MNSDARYDRVIQTICLLILAGIALALALYWLRPVMIPFVLALFVAFTLSPVVDFQVRRWRFPRAVAIGTALILGVAVLFAAAMLATTAVTEMTANAERYQAQFSRLVNNTIRNMPLERLGIDEDDLRRSLGVVDDSVEVGAAEEIEEPADESPAGAVESGVADGSGGAGGVAGPGEIAGSGVAEVPGVSGLTLEIPAAVGEGEFAVFSPAAISSLLQAIAGTVMSIISQGVLVLVFLIFMLAGDTSLSGSRGGSFGESALTVRHYVTTALLISAVTGFLVGLSLSLLGVEMALMFGFLAFVLNFIPNIGSIVATLLPLPIVLLGGGDDPNYLLAALALGIPGSIQMIIGNLITPKILGRSLDLHPLTILIGLIFWGMLWGLVGVLLAVPITAVIRIWLAKSPYTRPVANVLAGRSPVDPANQANPAVPATGSPVGATGGRKKGGKK